VTQTLLEGLQRLIEFQRAVLGDARGMSTNKFVHAQAQDLAALRSTLAAPLPLP
jgi:hypothetical protein